MEYEHPEVLEVGALPAGSPTGSTGEFRTSDRSPPPAGVMTDPRRKPLGPCGILRAKWYRVHFNIETAFFKYGFKITNKVFVQIIRWDFFVVILVFL